MSDVSDVMSLEMLVALSHLTPDQREAVIDHDYRGEAMRRIAKRQGVSETMARKRRDQGLERLRRVLGAMPEFEERRAA